MHQDPRALQALTSPARQELLSALGHGPATVTELGQRLGRSRQALYYHLATLAAAGLVKVRLWRGSGRERERVYALAVRRVAIGARAGSRADLATAERAVTALLRLTAREVRAAMRSPRIHHTGTRRELMALRGKARLPAGELRRLNGLLDQVAELLQRNKTRVGPDLFSVTVVLTPSRESGTTSPAAAG